MKLSFSGSRDAGELVLERLAQRAVVGGAFTTIERNLNIVNGCSPSPITRLTEQHRVRGSSTLIATAISASSGDSTTSSGTVITRSSARLVIGSRMCRTVGGFGGVVGEVMAASFRSVARLSVVG